MLENFNEHIFQISGFRISGQNSSARSTLEPVKNVEKQIFSDYCPIDSATSERVWWHTCASGWQKVILLTANHRQSHFNCTVSSYRRRRKLFVGICFFQHLFKYQLIPAGNALKCQTSLNLVKRSTQHRGGDGVDAKRLKIFTSNHNGYRVIYFIY